MPTAANERLTYEQWASRPESRHIEELLDGELVVTPAPRLVHQLVAGRIHVRLFLHAEPRGDLVVEAPFGIRTGQRTIVQPDVVYFLAANADIGPDVHTVERVPDLVVEVLSPSTRSHDRVRKRAVFEAHGIPEVWYVDTELARIEQLILGEDGTHGPPVVHEGGATLVSAVISGLRVDVDDVLRDAPTPGGGPARP